MTFRPDPRSSGARTLRCGLHGMVLPGSDERTVDVYLPGTAFTGSIAARDSDPRYAGCAPPPRVYVEPGTICLRTSVRGRLDAGEVAGHPAPDAEIPMTQMHGTLPLGAEMPGSTTCSDAEHFSGYIITTSRTK